MVKDFQQQPGPHDGALGRDALDLDTLSMVDPDPSYPDTEPKGESVIVVILKSVGIEPLRPRQPADAAAIPIDAKKTKPAFSSGH